MAQYFEEKVITGMDEVIVCIPHEKYSEFLGAVMEHNKTARSPAKIESLRPLVKRLTKGAISYQDFRGAYF